MPDNLPVERVAGNCDTLIAEDGSRARCDPKSRSDWKNGKVARAATKIPNHYQLVPPQLLLKTACRGDRLILEYDLLEPTLLHGLAQSCQCKCVRGFGSFSGKIDGPAHHDARWDRS